MKKLFKNARVIDPASGYNFVSDILVVDNILVKIMPNLEEAGAEVYDMTGLVAAPGLIDMHCHLREPGFEYKEDIKSGTASAAMGGFTAVAPMPNTKPTCDTGDKVCELLKKPAYADLLPIAAVTPGLSGDKLCDFAALKDAGAVGVSDDGKPVSDSAVMRNALLLAYGQGLTVVSHCEDTALALGGGMNDGAYARKLGYQGISAAAEEIMIARDLLLARTTGVPVHIAHVSTKTGVAMIRFAKENRVRVTAETCPHYFSLTQEAVGKFGANAKMNPPLRMQEDVDGIIEGLIDGTIDAIVTDHAPHSVDEKSGHFDQAPSGIIGFETALALGITKLVRPGHLTLCQLLEKMTLIPASILKTEHGKLRHGGAANIVFFDPNEQFIYQVKDSLSKSRNTPFDGAKLYGKVRYTVRNGEFLVKDGKFVGEI